MTLLATHARTHSYNHASLDRSRTNANKGDGMSVEVSGGSRWRPEWYNVYLVPGGTRRTYGCDRHWSRCPPPL